ncbi:MAG: HEAT repeat domain-containing protein [Planctomycetota bacterium]|nr:HEAT repeat domain-containing protein [Planctomycetota bacterium]
MNHHAASSHAARRLLTLAAGAMALTLVSGGSEAFAADAPATQPAAKPAAASAAGATLRDRAVQQILTSSRSADAFLRANSIEAAGALTDRVVPLAQLGLEDPHPAVRFAAAAQIGRLKLKSLAPACRKLLDDKSDSVRAAGLFALRACGQEVDISPLAAMLTGQDPSTRGNAAMLLGLLGDRSAIPMLKDTARVPLYKTNPATSAIVRIQVAEAVVRLGDDESLSALRAGLYSSLDEVRVTAVQMLGRAGDKRMSRPMFDILSQQNPPELQLAAAEGLARLGEGDGLPLVLRIGSESSAETVRAQAAMTLGLFKDADARAAIARFLDDPSEQVRLAAAAAALQTPVTTSRTAAALK